MTPKGESYQFIAYNRGKKSVTLNIKNRKGLERQEAGFKCDIPPRILLPGSWSAGLGYEEASKINPGIIYASISGFGQTAPAATR